MILVYTHELPPETFSKSIFLAGPTPRDKDVKSWRPEALKILRELNYDGVVFVPEDRNGEKFKDYEGQIEWEDKYLNMSDVIVFWIPRELKTMPAFTTNDEWGYWKNSGKVVFGAPPEAKKVSYQKYYANKYFVPSSDTLKGTLENALKLLEDGDERSGGERFVPYYIWRTWQFQNWYQAQKKASNTLCDARVLWNVRVGPQKQYLYAFGLWVDVYVKSENRHKHNEMILSRPDIACIALYKRNDVLEETEVVLVKEFRSPARTNDGFVWELPGGSSRKPNIPPHELASEEAFEETGLKISPDRLTHHGARQLAGTFSTHQAHLFSAEITDEELNWIKSQSGKVFGLDSGEGETGERTYVHVVKVKDIIKDNLVDWTNLGMILSVISQSPS